MAKWRQLFEGNLPPLAERQYPTEYEFGPPATADELAAAERALGVSLPQDVREMLSEFNGVWERTRYPHGESRDIAFLDLQNMTVDVPEYCSDSGNPMPDEADLRQVVWVAQSNGFGDLWGVCAAAVAGHPAGAVVRMDHEVGELEACQPNLEEFVRAGRFGTNNK